MNNHLIIYHARCLDGFTAAWVITNCLAHRNLECDLWPASYGEKPPPRQVLAGKTVYIVDFSYPRDTMERMAKHCHLVVLDHHASAQADCEGLDFCTFDMGKSGAVLAYEHFGSPMDAIGLGGEYLIDHTEDYDLWRFWMAGTKPIHHYLGTVEMTLSNWDQVAHDLEYEYDTVLQAGQAIERYVNQLVGHIAGEAYRGKLPVWGGYKKPVMMANCPPTLVSFVAQRLLKLYPGVPMAACWSQTANRQFVFSLRSRDGKVCNVAEIARGYNGGGHLTAAGFRSGEL